MNNRGFDFIVDSIDNIFERAANPDWEITDVRYVEKHMLAFCMDGAAIYTVDGEKTHIGANDICFFPKGLTRSGVASQDNPWHFIRLGFTLSHFPETCSDMDSFTGVYHSVPSHYRNAFVELLRLWSAQPYGYMIKCRAIVADIMHYIITARNAENYNPLQYKKIGEVLSYIQDNYTTQLDMNILCKISGYSDAHLRKLFREITGLPPLQYVNKLRVNIAKDLLISGETNVSDAAAAVGISDIYYFSRLFKKRTGHVPSYYLKHIIW